MCAGAFFAFSGCNGRADGMQCNTAYASNDVIPILPTAATDIARLNLRTRILKEKGLTHSLKKAPGNKKRKKGTEKDKTESTTITPPDSKANTSEEDKALSKAEKKEKKEKVNDGIKNASTAYLTKKVLEEQQERNKRRKLEQNENVKSLFRKSDDRPSAANSRDYMTRGFSIGKK